MLKRFVPTVSALATVVIVTAGCGSGSGSDSGSGYRPAAGAGAGAGAQPTCPLQGTWNGDDSTGIGSWYWSFSANCGVRMTNERRGFDRSGRYWVNGGQLYAQFGQGSPNTYTWSVSPDGRFLYLDGRSYVRAS